MVGIGVYFEEVAVGTECFGRQRHCRHEFAVAARFAACGNACPQKAITTNAQGIRVVDTDKCIGCGACHEACPWHMPTVNPETGKSSKCIACGACVAGCPSGALSIVDWDAVTSAAQAAYMDL